MKQDRSLSKGAKIIAHEPEELKIIKKVNLNAWIELPEDYSGSFKVYLIKAILDNQYDILDEQICKDGGEIK